jgi:hypothetical protein
MRGHQVRARKDCDAICASVVRGTLCSCPCFFDQVFPDMTGGCIPRDLVSTIESLRTMCIRADRK